MFNAINFQWPTSFANVQQASEQKLANAPGQINAAKGRLQAVPALPVTNNPVAGDCGGSMAALNQLRDLLANRTLCVCVHPWVQGVGQGEGHIRYLSPANAVAGAANKFLDTADAQVPQTTMEAICVVISATSFKQLGEAVGQFFAVLPNPQLGLCMRRAQQLATLERDKVELPQAPGNALWVPGRLSGVMPARKACETLGTQLAHAVGYESGGMAALQELTALADKKHQAIAEGNVAVESLADGFSGGSGKGVFIAAKSPQQIKQELTGSGLDHDAPLACCMVYAGAPGALSAVREVLGL